MRSVLVLAAALTACQSTADSFEVTQKSVDPASAITWLGEPTALVGADRLRVGAPFPKIELTNARMQQAPVAVPGRVAVIDTLPSVDTPVCDRQTHILGETAALAPDVQRITISADLPYAQRRFGEEAKLPNVEFFSDYRGAPFAKASGLGVERNQLLARAVIVVDRAGIIRHLQVVPEITQLPDMEAAFKVANALLAH